MARKKSKRAAKKSTLGRRRVKKLQTDTKRRIAYVGLIILGLLFVLAPLDLAGPVGKTLHSLNYQTFGVGFFVVPLVLFLIPTWGYLRSKLEPHISETVAAIVSFLTLLGFVGVLFPTSSHAGLVGGGISSLFVNLFDSFLAGVILMGLTIIGLLFVFDARVAIGNLRNRFSKKDDLEEEDGLDISDGTGADQEEPEEEEVQEEPKAKKAFAINGLAKKKAPEAKEEEIVVEDQTVSHKPYTPPPLSLLNKSKGKPAVGDIKASANIIQRTLQNFRIDVEIDEVSVGPTVTRFAVKPAEGVKLSRIVGLQNELALALAAHPIRVEAPIPGKSLVGIEIPNKSKTMLGLGSIFAESEFQKSTKPLFVTLGKGVSGKTYANSVAKMPHLLIAGATGAGKSVTVHTILTALLYKNSPEQLRLIMVDPKRVELTLYNGIPHLLTPVIKDPKKAILALKWAAKEMDRRYNIMESERVRDISSYHKNIVDPAYANIDPGEEIEPGTLPEKMPYIVFVIDELADIMQMYPKELEAGIVRLAQMSRAVGIHLILSTQRPEVNVITGLIKANVPARIALRVASQIDSRTILDASGAERLLGAGDMLYQSGNMSKPARMQCPYISEEEVKKVVKFLKKEYEEELFDEIDLSEQKDSGSMFSASLDSDDEGDELYEDARELVMHAGKASTSYIQRKLRVGYARAARLMDILEENGVIGPANGSKPRQVLEQFPTEDPAQELMDENPEASDSESQDYDDEEAY